MILAIIFLVLFAVAAGVSIYFTVSAVKTPMIEFNYKRLFTKAGIAIGAAVAFFIVASFGFYMWLGATPDALHVVELVVGAILFIGCLFIAINTFILHYYGKNIPEKLNKWLFRVMFIGFAAAILSLFLYTNGLAPYLTYPLVNGISFTQGFVTPATGKPNIAFYALCILGGAILVYFLADHQMYKEYGEHGTLESTFFVAFPAGIIGARIFYVMGEWSKSFDYGRAMTTMNLFGNEIKVWAPLAIWEGGLTIIGGALVGIVVGALWYMWRNKGKSIWVIFDIALPMILIAQAVGRWGNFFNCEVHGVADSIDHWKWLPEIIWRNAQYTTASGAESLIGTDKLYIPLFFIEAIVNLTGFFVLAYLFGKKLRKYVEFGDVGFGYLIWYGLTRLFMEPLRHSAFNMGENQDGVSGYWSWFWSIALVVGGVILIVGNHIVRNILRKKNNTFTVKPYDKKLGLISSLIIIAISAPLLVFGILNLNQGTFEPVMGYNQFNVGLMLLVLGVSALLCLGISVPIFINSLKGQSNAQV
ncbi:MAG: prolipoprotein diacylglyceryl transferase [Bacilli bacterium]|nr:prolipoprotein diacylglyceryl transferase [Bacilli bacterium]